MDIGNLIVTGKKSVTSTGETCEYQSTLCLHGPSSTVQAHTDTHRHCHLNTHSPFKFLTLSYVSRPHFSHFFPSFISLLPFFFLRSPTSLSFPRTLTPHFIPVLISLSRCLPLPLFFSRRPFLPLSYNPMEQTVNSGGHSMRSMSMSMSVPRTQVDPVVVLDVKNDISALSWSYNNPDEVPLLPSPSLSFSSLSSHSVPFPVVSFTSLPSYPLLFPLIPFPFSLIPLPSISIYSIPIPSFSLSLSAPFFSHLFYPHLSISSYLLTLICYQSFRTPNL